MRHARMQRHVLVGVALLLLPGAVAYGQAGGSGVRSTMVERDVRVTHLPPDWLAIPAEGRLMASNGVYLEPLQSASVSYENATLGMLIGAFRNVGQCLQDVSVRLRYTDAEGKPLGGPIENEARITMVDPDGLLPYRFRLKKKTELPRPATGYVLEVVEGDRKASAAIRWEPDGETPPRLPCPARPFDFDVTRGKSRATWTSYHVTGTLRVVAGGPFRLDGITLTALLLDKDQQVLEVLTGAPDVEGISLPTGYVETGQVLPFTLATPVPLGKWVSDVQIFAEILPDAQVTRPAR